MEFQEFSKILLKNFNSTIILTIFVPSFPVLPDIFVLNLNEKLLLLSTGKLAIASLTYKNGSSL